MNSFSQQLHTITLCSFGTRIYSQAASCISKPSVSYLAQPNVKIILEIQFFQEDSFQAQTPFQVCHEGCSCLFLLRALKQWFENQITCDLHHVDVSKNSSFPVHNEVVAVVDEVLPFHEQYALLLSDVPTIKG